MNVRAILVTKTQIALTMMVLTFVNVILDIPAMKQVAQVCIHNRNTTKKTKDTNFTNLLSRKAPRAQYENKQ